MQHIAILGRQPELGVAELERIYGADIVTPIFESSAALLDTVCKPEDIKRLGGSVKLAKIISELETPNFHQIERHISKTMPQHLHDIPEGKFRFGISVFGLDVKPETINAANLRIKKVIKATGRSVRVVPNKASALNSAQILHNQLTTPIGMELVIVKNGKKAILAQTIAEQDIDDYAARDQARPARDAFVGMLPPKLAQIMINLTGFKVDHAVDAPRILDPFCGTGVVLQEAALMDYLVYGTDLSEKMIDYSHRNMKWLAETYGIAPDYEIELGDAMSTVWSQPIDAIVCETYLGQPFSAPPSPAKLEQVRGNCNHIISEFLKNAASQIDSGTPLSLAVPAWRDKEGRFTHLPLIERLDNLGYRPIDFKHVDRKNLLYYRPDQIVARQLLILEKI